MPRYGDLDALSNKLEALSKRYAEQGRTEVAQDYNWVCTVIDAAPTADVEPVVHCKDCEYWTKQVDSLQGRCALGGHYPTGGWYCANGERRNDG